MFMPGTDGWRPLYGARRGPGTPDWQRQLQFHEYFHGDNGTGLGAAHQTGWTGLVAALIADGNKAGTPRWAEGRQPGQRPRGGRRG